MSMYNMIFGQNPISDFLLGLLNLTRENVGRFRDVFVEQDRIAVYTRNGGGNREHRCNTYSESREGKACPCPGCIISYRLPGHPLYIEDRDDEFDRTYATIYFRFPEEHKDLLLKLVTGKFEPDKRWIETLDALRAGKRPDVEAKMRPIFDKIRETLNKGEQGSVIEV